jgi:hypothetical protein
MVGPWGTAGLGWANTIAMASYGLFLTLLYGRLHGFRGAPLGPAAAAIGRQLAATAAVAMILYQVRPWLAGVDHTSLDGLVRLVAVLLPAAGVYVGLVTMLGGSELKLLVSSIRGESDGEADADT